MLKQGKKLLPPACLAMLMLFSWPALAGAEAVFSVDSATGSAGDTVTVSVHIAGVGSLDGVEGISGGEFELVYDPGLAAPQRPVTQGELIENFIFIYNAAYTESSIKTVFAASSLLVSEDGVIATYTFQFKTSGTLQPGLKNLKLFDQDVRPLEVGAGEESSGDDAEPGGGEAGEDSGSPEMVITAPTGTAASEPSETGDGGGITAPGEETGTDKPGDAGSETAGPEDEQAAVPPGSGSGGGFPIWPVIIACSILAAVGVLFYRYKRQEMQNE